MDKPERLILGDVVFDRALARLERADGSVVALRRQALRFLQVLVEHAPALVSKDALLDAVWGRQEVSENVIAQVVRELRLALADSAQAPRFIETRPRQGYRLLVEVRTAVAAPESPPQAQVAEVERLPDDAGLGDAGSRRSAPWRWVALLALVLLGMAALYRGLQSPEWSLPDAALDLAYGGDTGSAEPGSSQAWVNAESELYRGRLADLRAAVASGKAAASDRLTARRWELLGLLADGREYDTLVAAEALLQLLPDDLHLLLMREELSVRWRPPARWAGLEPWADRLPTTRRLLMEARRAGAIGEPEKRGRMARAVLAAAPADASLLRGLALAELAAAEAAGAGAAASLLTFDEAIGLLQQTGWRRAADYVLLERAQPARRVNRGADMLAQLREARESTLASEDPALHARLLQQEGVLLGVSGDPDAGLAMLDAAVSVYLQLGDALGASSALTASAAALNAAGRLDEVSQRLQDAQQQAQRSGHLDSLAAITGNFALHLWRRGEAAAAVAELRRALAHFQQAGRPHDVAQAQHNLATLLRESGSSAEVAVLREQALRHAEAAGLRAALGPRLQGRAEDHYQRGDREAAMADLNAAVAAFDVQGDAQAVLALRCREALWESDNGALIPAPPPEASASHGHPAWLFPCGEWQARHLAGSGDRPQALSVLQTWSDEMTRQGHVRLATLARLRRLELELDALVVSPAIGEELAQQARAAARSGDGGLAREVAVLLLRLALRQGESEQAELALASLRHQLHLAPDARTAMLADCLQVRLQPGRLQEAARLRCETQAERVGHRRAAQQAITQPN